MKNHDATIPEDKLAIYKHYSEQLMEGQELTPLQFRHLNILERDIEDAQEDSLKSQTQIFRDWSRQIIKTNESMSAIIGTMLAAIKEVQRLDAEMIQLFKGGGTDEDRHG